MRNALEQALERDQANTDIDLRDLLRHTYAALAARSESEHCPGCGGHVATYSGQGEGYECPGLAARSEVEGRLSPAIVGQLTVAYRLATTPGESIPAGWTLLGVWENVETETNT